MDDVAEYQNDKGKISSMGDTDGKNFSICFPFRVKCFHWILKTTKYRLEVHKIRTELIF